VPPIPSTVAVGPVLTAGTLHVAARQFAATPSSATPDVIVRKEPANNAVE